MSKPSIQHQMRKGTTTVVILKLLADLKEPAHGYEIIRRLEEKSGGFFEFKEGLIYPRLHQLERDNLLKSEWLGKPGTRRRKVYAITEAGRRRLAEELAQWQQLSITLNQMLGVAQETAG